MTVLIVRMSLTPETRRKVLKGGEFTLNLDNAVVNQIKAEAIKEFGEIFDHDEYILGRDVFDTSRKMMADLRPTRLN